MKVSQECIDELVRRIRTVIQPKRIVLFGSAAKGEMGPHSDLDVLVVVNDDTEDCRAVARRLYRAMRGFKYAQDILVVPEGDVKKYKDNTSLVIHTALNEGRELYNAAS